MMRDVGAVVWKKGDMSTLDDQASPSTRSVGVHIAIKSAKRTREMAVAGRVKEDHEILQVY